MNLFLAVLVLVAGFVLLVKGADFFVDGAVGIAARFGIPQLVIGLTIAAMGTSMPEAAVSITSALKGSAGITVGNVVGSNIINILIILGVTAIIAPIAVQKSTRNFEIPGMIAVTVLFLMLGYTLFICSGLQNTIRMRKSTMSTRRSGVFLFSLLPLSEVLPQLCSEAISLLTEPQQLPRHSE